MPFGTAVDGRLTESPVADALGDGDEDDAGAVLAPLMVPELLELPPPPQAVSSRVADADRTTAVRGRVVRVTVDSPVWNGSWTSLCGATPLRCSWFLR
jgi:hypothetical protein